jgi:hypothetical protein
MGVGGHSDSQAEEQLSISQSIEDSFQELGFDLGGDPDDILTGSTESDEIEEAEDGPAETESVDEQPTLEDDPEDEVVDSSDAAVLEVPEGAILKLPDGTEVEADKAILFQKDYTKKTQQLSEERKQFEQERTEFQEEMGQFAEAYQGMVTWYEERSGNPTFWAQEIISETPDPTATIARVLYELAQAGKLDPQFVSTFGIDAGEVAEKAQAQKSSSEIEDLRRKLEQRELEEARQADIQRQVAVYQQQWDEIKQTRGASFDSAQDEADAKKDLLKFARDNKLGHSLVDAYDLMQVRRGRTVDTDPVEPKSQPEVTAKKRASRAVTPKSSNSGTSKVLPKNLSARDAAIMALEEFASAPR